MARRHGVRKPGGRPRGAQNYATRELKAFLQGVFREALLDHPETRAKLVDAIRTFTLEPRLLQVLLAHAYGAPPRAVDVRHDGQVSLAQLVSGSALTNPDFWDDDEDDDPEPVAS